MKLALFDNTIYGYATGDSMAGGNAKWQWLLARALAQTDSPVVVAVRDRLSPRQEEIIDGVRFVGLQQGNLLAAWSRFLSTERPDWWYWQGAEALWGALLFVAKTKGVRGIFSTSSDGDIRPRTALMRRRRWWPMYAWGLNTVERIFVQHRGQLSALNPKLQPKTNIVPGLVLTRERVKSRSERCNYVAWVAFLREQKRPDLLFEIARKTPDVQYVVCGGTTTYLARPGYGDDMVRKLRSLPNVKYLGHTSANRALQIMAEAAALLCTSELEGFPNTFLEAWSVGTPVISLGIDPGGVIQDRGLGFVSRTAEQAVSDIRRLLNCPQTFDAVSAAARQYVEDVHSDTAVAAVFKKAIGA